VHGTDDDRHKVANHLEYSELKQLWLKDNSEKNMRKANG
jgi:hypothetical protein